MITLLFDLEPVPKGRPRLSRSGIAYTPAKTRAFEKSVRILAERLYKNQFPMVGPLRVLISFELSRPKSVKEKSRPFPCVKPDLDNQVKGVLDALNGVIWEDDAQICDLHAIKNYREIGKQGRILVQVGKVI